MAKKTPSQPSRFSELLIESGDRGWRLPSGWPVLDSTAMSFRPGELTLVTGRTGHGKTHFLMNLLAHWMDNAKGRFLFYSFEVGPQALARRLKTVVEAVRGGDKAPLKQRLKPWKDFDDRLWLRFEPTWDVGMLVDDASAQVSPRKPVAAIFVDPVTALGVPEGKERDRRRDLELSYVLRSLKELAHKLACPVVATAPTRLLVAEDDKGRLRELLAQGTDFANVEVEDAIRKRRPRLEHLREKGLEQEADLVLGLLNMLADYQEELDPEARQVFKKRSHSMVELAALKNRFGSLDSVELQMDFKSGRIRDYTQKD